MIKLVELLLYIACHDVLPLLIHCASTPLVLLPTCSSNVVSSCSISRLDRTKDEVDIDHSIQVPNGLTLRACQLCNTTELVVLHMGYTEEFESYWKVHGKHELDIAIELGGGSSIEDELAYGSERDYPRSVSASIASSRCGTHTFLAM